MSEKISVEEEKKLISIRSYIDKLEKQQVYNENFIEEKEKLVAVLKNSITALGMATQNVKVTETEIMEVFENDLMDDLYEDFKKDVKGYITHSRNRFLLQEQVIQNLANYILTILEGINEVSTPSKSTISNLDDGEPVMDEEERQELKRRANALILHYKKTDMSGKKKLVVHRLYTLANTKEKFNIMDDMFLEMVGERLLTKFKKEKERQEAEENKKKIQEVVKDTERGVIEAREQGQDNQAGQQA